MSILLSQATQVIYSNSDRQMPPSARLWYIHTAYSWRYTTEAFPCKWFPTNVRTAPGWPQFYEKRQLRSLEWLDNSWAESTGLWPSMRGTKTTRELSQGRRTECEDMQPAMQPSWYLEIPVDDGWFLPVHVLHCSACLVEDLQNAVAGQRAFAFNSPEKLHQLS